MVLDADDAERRDWLVAKTMELLRAAADDDDDAVADLIAETGSRYGYGGVYVLCCGLAHLVAQDAVGHLDDGGGDADGFYGFEVVDTRSGQVVDPDGEENMQAIVAAHRFIAAQLNNDGQGSVALFKASPLPVATGLAVVAGAYVRNRIGRDGQARADGTPPP